MNDSDCVTDAPFAFEHNDSHVISGNDVQNLFVSISVVAQYYQYATLPYLYARHRLDNHPVHNSLHLLVLRKGSL